MTPVLAALARSQGGVFTRRQALESHSRQEVDRFLSTGVWVCVRRPGVYATAELVRRVGDGVPRHLLDCAARVLVTRGDAVVSHGSAATAFGIPLRDALVGTTLTLSTPGSATSGGARGRYLADVPAHHRTTLQGIQVTLPARTVADLCRTTDTRAALVVADGGLRMGVERDDVLAVLAECMRWPEVVAAREVVTLASRWSESALESISLHWCRVQGLPQPEQQLTIRTEGGRFLARVDQVWEEYRTIGELDGRKKYTADTRLPEAVVWQEKLRQDAIADAGAQVVRGYWSDDRDCGAAWAARLRRAFERGTSYTAPPTYRISDERDHAQRGPLAA